MFFLKSKIHIILFSTIISLFISLFVLYIQAIKNLEKEKQKNLYLENSLKTQTQAIKKIQIDTQVFNANVDTLQSEVRNKYEIQKSEKYENKEISTNTRNKHFTNSTQKQGFTIPVNSTSYNSVNNANSQDRINILLHENTQLQKELQTAKSLLKIRLE